MRPVKLSTSFSISIFSFCGSVSLLTSQVGIPLLATVSLITIIFARKPPESGNDFSDHTRS